MILEKFIFLSAYEDHWLSDGEEEFVFTGEDAKEQAKEYIDKYINQHKQWIDKKNIHATLELDTHSFSYEEYQEYKDDILEIILEDYGCEFGELEIHISKKGY